MSDYSTRVREYQRAKKRQQREELRIAREIGKRRKEQEKAEERDRAVLEVSEFEAQLGVVLSLHREAGEIWDWTEILHSLPPCPPTTTNRRENRVRQNMAVAIPEEQKSAENQIDESIQADRLEDHAAVKGYEEERAEWERMTALARRVLGGDVVAYRDAIAEFSPLSEIEHLGSSIELTMHSRSFVECVLEMKSAAAIPVELKTISSNGKLSVKAMPRQQFHEIYQDYICGGVLRVARELFALLPIEDVLVTVFVPMTEVADVTGNQPVVSAVITRSAVNRMDFERLDPSDTIEKQVCRSNFKATRKTGAFQPIMPIKFEEVVLPTQQGLGVEQLIRCIALLRNELKEEIAKLQETSNK